MKSAIPLLALIVAILIVLSQSLYTVDQKQFAIKFQLGEFIDAKSEAGLYAKLPLVQNVKFYEKRILTLDAPEPDRITTSEKKPLKVDFIAYWRIIDVRKYYQSVQGDEEAAKRRLAQTIRANLAQEINKRTIQEAITRLFALGEDRDAGSAPQGEGEDRRRENRRVEPFARPKNRTGN